MRLCKQTSTKNKYEKEATSSPTLATELVLLTAVMKGKENCDVAVVDIPGTFLQADINKDVWMALDGTLEELMGKVSPKLYSKCVTTGNQRKKVLYIKLVDKAIYGLLKSALQFYKRLSKDLTKMGFKIKYYDQCVANK